jgi:histone H3/H4
LIVSFKQNLSKYSCPEKFILTKLEFEKLGDKFTEFKNNVSAVIVLNKMLESIGLSLLEDALKCAYYVIQLVYTNVI